MNADPVIEVINLTKHYGGRAAVCDVSFTVNRGDIVGLLGPNGAGKSTTMRILACYIPATSGTARVAGFDVFREPDEVRRRIGYMPEHNPLYPEMRVWEYLKFRARLKGLSRKRARERLDVVTEQFGLKDVRRRLIGHLSKGYRQRVGLADALLHEPELLILDEPTLGLDPHQLRSVRQLIKELAASRTVLISTHILPEAELTCTRIVIMHRGRVLAEGPPDKLRERADTGSMIVAELAAPADALRDYFEAIPEIESFDIAPADGQFNRCMIVPRAGLDLRPVIFHLAKERGWTLRELTRSRFSLEDVYVRVTETQAEEEG
ncbi:MAG: ABC transporter ATP-binding protein [Verrucomicrobiae bacterium]|nr:ABC transporter ATP-binding protein [Verrucomicrobiae bacterium]